MMSRDGNDGGCVLRDASLPGIATSRASQTAGVLRIANEVLQFKPSGLVIYMGNNEGIGLSAGMGDVTVPRLQPVASVLHQLRLYRFLADQLIPARQRLAQAPTDVVRGF
jgi:hypothetical protein